MKPKCRLCGEKPVSKKLKYYCSLRCAAQEAITAMDYSPFRWCEVCGDWIDTTCPCKHLAK
jgi:hypothetical protein